MLLHKMQLLSIFYVEKIFFGRCCYLIIISVSSKLVIMKTDKSRLTAHHVYMQSSIAGLSHILYLKEKKIGSPPQYSRVYLSGKVPHMYLMQNYQLISNLFENPFLKPLIWRMLSDTTTATGRRRSHFYTNIKKNIVF